MSARRPLTSSRLPCRGQLLPCSRGSSPLPLAAPSAGFKLSGRSSVAGRRPIPCCAAQSPALSAAASKPGGAVHPSGCLSSSGSARAPSTTRWVPPRQHQRAHWPRAGREAAVLARGVRTGPLGRRCGQRGTRGRHTAVAKCTPCAPLRSARTTTVLLPRTAALRASPATHCSLCSARPLHSCSRARSCAAPVCPFLAHSPPAPLGPPPRAAVCSSQQPAEHSNKAARTSPVREASVLPRAPRAIVGALLQPAIRRERAAPQRRSSWAGVISSSSRSPP